MRATRKKKRRLPGSARAAETESALPSARLRVVTPAGELVREATAVREERPDPDSAVRTVRGWRAASPLDHIRSPSVTRDHRRAAARFAATVEAIEAAGYGHTARLPTGAPPGLSAAVAGPAESALVAVRDYRGACQAIGLIGTALVTAVAVDGYSASRLARITSGSDKVVLGRLLAALDRLVEHYDQADGRRR